MMKTRSWSMGLIVIGLLAGAASASAQATFKIPFKFEAAGNKLPAGDYRIAPKGADQLSLRQEPDGPEILVPFAQRLEIPAEPIAEPQLLFHVVGNFEPSYTEYVTDYVLAELWMPGEQGYLVRAMKGAHGNQWVKGTRVKK
jgi:hypothetical protein